MKTRLLLALLSLSLVAVSSCKKGADPITNNCERASRLAEDYQKAATAFSTSQTKANCEAFKKAGNDFLTAAGQCSTVSQADVNEAKQELANYTCQ